MSDVIHLLPIEPFEERYTEQWFRWWSTGLREQGFNVNVIEGYIVGERKGGEWLSPVDTWIWKGRQVENLARAWSSGMIKDGDIIFSTDLWNPCMTAALYMKHTTGIDVKICGFYHAGASDPQDFLTHKGCRKWALDVERGWVKGIDYILCGSNFAGKMLRDQTSLWKGQGAKIYATGYPFNIEEIRNTAKPVPWSERERLVVFPHRLAPEKQPNLFQYLKLEYEKKYGKDGTKFVRSRDVCKDKTQYYKLLAKSRVVFSAAKQETFGIAQQEGAILGAWMLNPRCLSYPEVTRDHGMLYKPYDIDEAVVKLHELLNKGASPVWDSYHDKAIERAAKVFRNSSTISVSDYDHPSVLQEEFWKGTYEGNRTLFINAIPEDFVGRMYFHQELSVNSYADHIYFTETFDIYNKANQEFIEDCSSVKKVYLSRYIDDVNDKKWVEFYNKYKNKLQFEFKINCDLETLSNSNFTIGKPFTHYTVKLNKENIKFEKDFYNDEI